MIPITHGIVKIGFFKMCQKTILHRTFSVRSVKYLDYNEQKSNKTCYMYAIKCRPLIHSVGPWSHLDLQQLLPFDKNKESSNCRQSAR